MLEPNEFKELRRHLKLKKPLSPKTYKVLKHYKEWYRALYLQPPIKDN